MLKLCKCRCKVEDLKVNDIVFCLSKFEMTWHERLWACVYKRVEVKMMNENAKSFLCVKDEKSWNIEPNKKNSSLKTLNNNVTKYSWNIELFEIIFMYIKIYI